MVSKRFVCIDVTGRLGLEEALVSEHKDAMLFEGDSTKIPFRPIEWLTEEELWIFISQLGDQVGTRDDPDPHWAKVMFDAFMGFNARASSFRFSPSVISSLERELHGLQADEPIVWLRLLVNEAARSVATSSVIALARDPLALALWTPEKQPLLAVIVKRWAESLVA